MCQEGVELQTSIFDFSFSVRAERKKNELHHNETEREGTGLGASYTWEILQRYAQNQATLLTTLHLLAELTSQRVENLTKLKLPAKIF